VTARVHWRQMIHVTDKQIIVQSNYDNSGVKQTVDPNFITAPDLLYERYLQSAQRRWSVSKFLISYC